MMIAVIVVAVYLTRLIRPFTSLPAASASPVSAEEHRAAALWASSFVAYTATALWAAAVSYVVLRRYLSSRTRRIVLTVAALSAVAGLFARLIYGSKVAPLSLVVQRGVPVYDITALGRTITAALLILCVATCVSLVTRSNATTLTAKELRERSSYARMSLYSFAALLIVGVVQIYFLNDWPSHVHNLTSEPMRKGLHEMAYTAALVTGTFYSAILLILYVPVLAIHDGWIAQLAERTFEVKPETDMAEWRNAQGLGRSTTATLGEIAAVVGPWLAAVGLPKLLLGA